MTGAIIPTGQDPPPTIQSTATLEPIHPPVQWVPGILSPGLMWPGCEANHSCISSSEIHVWIYEEPG
jgi:hypothetical protein